MAYLLSLTDKDKAALHHCAPILRAHLEELYQQRMALLLQAEEIPAGPQGREGAVFADFMRRATAAFVEALATDDGLETYLERGRIQEEVRAQIRAGMSYNVLMAGIASNQQVLVPFLVEQTAGDPAWQRDVLQALLRFYAIESAMFGQAYIAEKERVILETQERIIAVQKQAIQELSSPVIQVWEGVLVLPLVGAIDSERARRMTEGLLNGIRDHQAEQVIIDITGVPVVDTSIANHLLQAIKAARLLGANCLLVGINAEVAQTMVHLGIDLSGVITRANLQAGIEYVLARMGLGVAPLTSDAGNVKRHASGAMLPKLTFAPDV